METDSLGIGAVTVQPEDEKIVAAGSGNLSQFALARYTPAGALDPSFGNGGIVETLPYGVTNCYAHTVTMHMGGIPAVGNDGAGTRFVLIRYLESGDLDPSFGGTGIVTSDFTGGDQADAATVDDLGRILVVGNVWLGAAEYDWAVACYLPNGMLDPTFGNNGLSLTDVTGYERAHAVAIQPDGKIVSAGFARVPGTSSRQFAVVRHNPDGTLDEDFGSGGKVVTPILDNAEAESVVIQSDGKIVAIGWASDEAGFCIAMARYHPDGQLDASFGVEGGP